ncbi:hypothetical protein PVT71_10750 [Salipiger sp. H15]|uniref:Uncharacterized protein n=1 Tax=Alloyangia sp. H15 TaxID=3029062 RepID=A0AAU8AFH9_9RHOB
MIRSSICSMIAIMVSCGPALADMDQVKCDKFIISVDADIVKMAEEKAGSLEQAESNICEAAGQFDVPTDEQEVHDIRIEPYGISTTIIIFPPN